MTDQELEKIGASTARYFYISKGCYYRPGAAGYTDFRTKAGLFKKTEAISHATGCRELTLIPVDEVEHNQLIREEIAELSSRIIKIARFMDLLIAGEVDPSSVDDYIEEWHTSEKDLGTLHAFLGMSASEYNRFVRNGNSELDVIVSNRKKMLGLKDVGDDVVSVDWEKVVEYLQINGSTFHPNWMEHNTFRESLRNNSSLDGLVEAYDKCIDEGLFVTLEHHSLVGHYLMQKSGQGAYIVWWENQPTDPNFLL